MGWLGIDIGGANLKISDGRCSAHSQPFALWKSPRELPGQLQRLLSGCDAGDALAVTMTGELADCFASKAEGVQAIIQAVLAAAPDREVRIYLTDGRLVPPQVALAEPLAGSRLQLARAGRLCRPLCPAGFGLADRSRLDDLRHRALTERPACRGRR